MKSKTTLAVVLIVKNEAHNLHQCLTTVAGWVDEIVVMDAGSTDKTREIAKAFNAQVVVNAEWPGFGRQRQLAQSYVTADWVLWLDADERVTPELRDAILTQLQIPPDNTLFALPRLSWAFGRFIRHSGWYPDYVVRLYPRTLTSYEPAPVHEKVMIPHGAQIIRLKGDLLHYPYKDLRHYLSKSAHYAETWAQHQASQTKTISLAQGILHGIGCFIRMYVFKAGFLDRQQGLLLALLSAHYTFTKYADFWVRTHAQNPSGQQAQPP